MGFRTSACSAATKTPKAFPIRCVKACPVRAIEFGMISDLRAKYGDADAIGELTNTTGPNVVFGLHRDAAKGGILRNPLEVSHEA